MQATLIPPGYSSFSISGLPDYGLPKPPHLAPAPPINMKRVGSEIVLTQGANRLVLDAASISALELSGTYPAKGPGSIYIHARLKDGRRTEVFCYWYHTKEVTDWLLKAKPSIEAIFGLKLELDFSTFGPDI